MKSTGITYSGYNLYIDDYSITFDEELHSERFTSTHGYPEDTEFVLKIYDNRVVLVKKTGIVNERA